jgi:hypothetical protein
MSWGNQGTSSITPSVFAEADHLEFSTSYTFVSTAQVVDRRCAEG